MNTKLGSEERQAGEGSKNRDYDIGYGKPPNATRFQKGQSGNPAGRRRGSKNLSTILDEELEQRVVIRENGKQKTITKRRASMKQLVNKAASGDHRALQILINSLHDLEGRTGTVEEDLQLDEIDREIVGGILERFQNVGKNGGGGNANE
jgi:Family of unknown function (DUF5681)